MAVAKDVEVTLMNNTKVFIPQEYFYRGGVPETPEACIGDAVRGSRSPIISVNTLANMSGDWLNIVAQNIMSFKVVNK